ncbi:MAG TPA: hypothetical protein VH349_00450 [Ktedonobacterales bacterium]|jgi:hypothetical protein
MNQTDLQDSELDRALRQQFHERYGDPPPVAPLWSNLSTRLAARENRSAQRPGLLARAFRFPIRSGRRLSLRQSIALSLFLVVAIGATSYSASILLHPLLQVPAAAGRVYTQVDQTRTLGDVTITVEQAVADSDWIIIGVSAERPCLIPTDACYYDLAAPFLTTQDGQEIKAKAILSDSAYRPGKQEAAYVFFFKPPTLTGQPTNLNLHLELRLVGDSGMPVGDAAVFDFTLPNHTGASF